MMLFLFTVIFGAVAVVDMALFLSTDVHAADAAGVENYDVSEKSELGN